MFKIDIKCDSCQQPIDINPTTISSRDSVEGLLEILNWDIIKIPENLGDVEPYKYFVLCEDCDEEEFYHKNVHPQCSLFSEECAGKIFQCTECKKLFCRCHFFLKDGLCKSCLTTENEQEAEEKRQRQRMDEQKRILQKVKTSISVWNDSGLKYEIVIGTKDIGFLAETNAPSEELLGMMFAILRKRPMPFLS